MFVIILNHIVCIQEVPILPTEGIAISWVVGDSLRPKNLKKCVKLYWNFQRGGGYRYFLELHIIIILDLWFVLLNSLSRFA